jgi:uncharacterized membrane protein
MKAIYFYYTALVGFFGLFALSMLWHTLLFPATHFPVALILLLTVTPLLLPMRGLLARRPKSCAWAAYVSLLYFIHGVQEAYANVNERELALLEVLLSLLLFFGAIFYVRFVGRRS